MPSPVNTPAPTTTTGTNITTTAETVVGVSGPVNADNVEPVVTIAGTLDLTVGTAGTAVTLKVRRGTSVSGAQVGQSFGPFSVTAAGRYNFTVAATDNPGLVGGQVYCVTATVTAATGNSTCNTCVVEVEASAGS